MLSDLIWAHVLQNEGCILSMFKHFDQTIASGNKNFRLVTLYLPLPSKKNDFTVERVFFSEFSAFLEELAVTSCLLFGDLNFHVDDNSNANAKQFSNLLFSADLKLPIIWDILWIFSSLARYRE